MRIALRTRTAGNLGGNSGNLLFGEVTRRLLTAGGNEVVTEWPGPGDADRISADYDHLVLPLANAFKRRWGDELHRLAELVERVTIPVTVLGAGIQAPRGVAPALWLRAIRSGAARFTAAVLNRGPLIAVRGEITEAYVAGLGFDASVPLGCPSMFWHGPRLARRPSCAGSSPVLAMKMKPAARRWAAQQLATHPRAVMVVQSRADVAAADPVDLVDQRCRWFDDADEWISWLAGRTAVAGNRLHGAAAGIAAGLPVVLVTPDQRVAEVADYHLIPQRAGWEPLQRLLSHADMRPMAAGHEHRWDRLVAYLRDHGLSVGAPT